MLRHLRNFLRTLHRRRTGSNDGDAFVLGNGFRISTGQASRMDELPFEVFQTLEVGPMSLERASSRTDEGFAHSFVPILCGDCALRSRFIVLGINNIGRVRDVFRQFQLLVNVLKIGP